MRKAPSIAPRSTTVEGRGTGLEPQQGAGLVASKNKFPWYLCAFLLTLVLFLSSTAIAFAQGADDALEREAQAIDKMIMCPVCPAETIDQAQVEISFQMRAVVRELLAEGRTRDEVLDYFVDRYGADILAAPPKSGSNLVAWILPVVGVAAGLVGVFFVIRAMTGSQRRDAPPAPSRDTSGEAPQAPASANDADLLPYLEIADRVMASRRAASRHSTAPVALTEGFTPPDAEAVRDDPPARIDQNHG